jgi:hypothetical protein
LPVGRGQGVRGKPALRIVQRFHVKPSPETTNSFPATSGRPRILTHSRHPPPRSNERDNLQSLTAGETVSSDESPLLGQRLSKIAHIRRALQKAKDPARWAPLASSTSFSAQAAHFHSPPDSGHVAASHRSATKSADARRGAAHGGELRQATGSCCGGRRR